jgi:hypothetical protein
MVKLIDYATMVPNAAAPSLRAQRSNPSLGSIRKNLLFLKKKKQKNFCSFSPRPFRPSGPLAKVFWFFFSKKNAFLPSWTQS